MATFQITCINKSNRQSAHEAISHVGGPRWRKPQPTVIAEIKAQTNLYFTSAGGRSAWVVVASSASGHEYLKTENDGDFDNNLLALPECPLA